MSSCLDVARPVTAPAVTSRFRPAIHFTDAGMTWRKYEGNPVLTRNSANFRDPKVFRYQGDEGACWVMVAVEAEYQKVVFYRQGRPD